MADFGNYSALIGDLNSQIAAGPPKVDWSGIERLPDSFQSGFKQNLERKQATAFRDGIPTNEQGQPDYGAMAKKMYQVGDYGAAKELAGLDLARQGITAQAETNRSLFPPAGGPTVSVPPAATGGTAQPAMPRSSSVPSAPANQYGGADASGAGSGTSVMGILASRGIPEHAAIKIAQAAGVDPNAPLDAQGRARVVEVMRKLPTPAQPAQAQAAQPAQAQPQTPAQPVQQPSFNDRYAPTNGPASAPANPAAPVSPSAAPTSDPTLGGLVPKGVAVEDYLNALHRAASNPLMSKEASKGYLDRADAIQKAMGQIRESGLKERQGVIEPVIKQIVDRTGESQQKANALADGILVSHDLRAQLDAKAGIFSGQWADKKLALSKIGLAIGLNVQPDQITNTEAFSALVGKKVAQTVKSFGSGTSITNQDREYAAKMEAGDIKLDETSMRRILEITDKINRASIVKHNKGVDDLVKSRPEIAHLAPNLKVDIPPLYESTNRPPAGAIDFLKANPATRAQFEKHWPGFADKVLSPSSAQAAQ